MRTIRVVAAVISQDGKYLITQRRETAVLPLLWEFPGGKVEEGEEDDRALERELAERLGAKIRVGMKVGERRHEYDGYVVELALYAADLLDEHLEPRRVRTFRWVGSGDFDQYRFPDADQATMDVLLGVRQ